MDFGILRNLLHRPPSTELFDEVLASLDLSKRLPSGMDDYLCEHFERWPKEIVRPVPYRLLEDLRRGYVQHVGPWFNCVRLYGERAQSFVEMFEDLPALSNVDRLSFGIKIQGPSMELLTHLSIWDRLRWVHHHTPLYTKGLAGLCSLLHRAPLETLILEECSNLYTCVRLWEDAPFWNTLRTLRLSHTVSPKEGPMSAHQWSRVLCNASLSTLSLEHAGWTDEHARMIASKVSCETLRTLALGNNEIGSEGAVALSQSVHLKGLQHLYLADNSIGSKGAIALTNSPQCSSLQTLSLQFNDIGCRGLEALLNRSLGLSDTTEYRAFTSDTLDTSWSPRNLPIANMHRSDPLFIGRRNRDDIYRRDQVGVREDAYDTHVLNLSGIPFRTHTMDSLALSPKLACVSLLNLSACSLHDEHIEVLVDSPHLTSLRALVLGDPMLTEETLVSIASSECIDTLELLHLYGMRIDDSMVNLLLDQTLFPSLTVVYLHSDHLSEETQHTLRASHLIVYLRHSLEPYLDDDIFIHPVMQA